MFATPLATETTRFLASITNYLIARRHNGIRTQASILMYNSDLEHNTIIISSRVGPSTYWNQREKVWQPLLTK